MTTAQLHCDGGMAKVRFSVAGDTTGGGGEVCCVNEVLSSFWDLVGTCVNGPDI